MRLLCAACLLILLLAGLARAITPSEMAERIGKSWTAEQALHREMATADSLAWQASTPRWGLYVSLQGGASETNTASPSESDSWSANAGLAFHIREPNAKNPSYLYGIQEQIRRDSALFQLRYD